MKIFKNLKIKCCYYFVHLSNSIIALKLPPSAYFSYKHHFPFLISEENKKGHPEESCSLFCILSLRLSAIVSEISKCPGVCIRADLNRNIKVPVKLRTQSYTYPVQTGLTPQCSGCGPLLVPLTADPGELTWGRCTGNFQPFQPLDLSSN